MRIMSDKSIAKDEVQALVDETISQFDKKVKLMKYLTLASCWVSITTLLVVIFK